MASPEQALQVIARATGGRAPTRFPAVMVFKGQPFIFHHDRQGGEAFVMLRQGANARK